MKISFRILSLAAIALLAGCVAKPQEICAELVPATWVYIGHDSALDKEFGARLPRAPLSVRQGKTFNEVRHYWYRGGEDRLMACTLGRGARDNCTLNVNEFWRANGEWTPGYSDAVLCNVIAANPGKAASRD